MRLIDADELIMEINMRIADYKRDCNTGAQRMAEVYEYEIRRMVEKQSIAYNVDRVVEEIKNIGTRYCTTVHCNDECSNCDHGAIMRAIIEIVKRGGTDDGN